MNCQIANNVIVNGILKNLGFASKTCMTPQRWWNHRRAGFASYVAIATAQVPSFLKNIKDQKIKGKKLKIEVAR
jgi:hypothetical protein